MIGKTPKEHQMSIFEVALESFIKINHELVLLPKQIGWEAVDSEFAKYYSEDSGRPNVPNRMIVGKMLLKSIYILTDDGVATYWMENPYMYYLIGEMVFQKRPPMNPFEMTKFRNRIGTMGTEKMFKIHLLMIAKEISGKEMNMVIDSTERLKMITFPADAKSFLKIIAIMQIMPQKKFQKRVSFDPVIGYLKLDLRMIRKYMESTREDVINTLMVSTACKLMRCMHKNTTSLFVTWLKTGVEGLENVIFGNVNQYANPKSNLAMVA